ncbi:MAG: DUF4870 domain-containing protein [Candidatus Aenigmarchaeota archaeon]|nr:DUF4870 domain-containing protein [Candidatus Aenigmarchaeota archaeon]
MGKHTGLAVVAYFFGILGGIIVLLVAEHRDKFTRFHALQGILFNIAAGIVGLALAALSMPFMMGPWWGFMPWTMIWAGGLWAVYGIVVLVVWLLLMVKAYHGEAYELPVIGELAKQWSR